MARRCSDCRDGEHENYDDWVELTVVCDPKTKKLVKKALLCGEHTAAYLDDGYRLSVVG